MTQKEHMLDKEQRKALNIDNEWITTEINPKEIAEALGGKLEISSDADSKWDIHLHYGRKNPVITLKIDPEKRKAHIAFHGPKRKNFFTYRYSDTFYDIESIRFVKYYNENHETRDLYFLVRMGKNQKAGGFVISSHYHRSFECKSQQKPVIKMRSPHHPGRNKILREFLEKEKNNGKY